MERFYDGDQEQLYAEARVVNPYRKPVSAPKKVSICYPWLTSFVHDNDELCE